MLQSVDGDSAAHPLRDSFSQSQHVTRPKKLIVCCDGTWMDADNGYVKGKWGRRGHAQSPSNVTRLSRAVQSEDDSHIPQLTYYQSGVGSGIGFTNQVLGGGTGLGLEENIREAYAFLASNYRERDPELPGVPPDSIFLVGFSRGAYTARSIAGLLGALGLLKKRAMPHFYEVFSDWIHAGDRSYTPLFFDSYFQHSSDVKSVKPSDEVARDRSKIDEYLNQYFRILLSLDLTQEVQIKGLGVWDTVGALGIPVNPILQRLFFLPSFLRDYRWYDTRLDRHIENAFQALALDERRYPFFPTLWEKPEGCTTNMKQTWFPGSHSNVGGSYEDTGIANLTLAWMMDNLSGNTTEHPNGFNPLDWIKFDEEYIEDWAKSELIWYEKHKKQEYQGWGMGKLYDSNYFPMSLTGTRIRTPGRHRSTFYETGEMNHRMLENTEERIHSSVRARIDLAGRPLETDWTRVFPNGLSVKPWLKWIWRRISRRPEKPYQPQRLNASLNGWRLADGHESHRQPNMEIVVDPTRPKQVEWVYEGDGACSTKRMPEDKLGPFELQLLQKDQEFADKITVSNNAWSWSRRKQRNSIKLQHTF